MIFCRLTRLWRRAGCKHAESPHQPCRVGGGQESLLNPCRVGGGQASNHQLADGVFSISNQGCINNPVCWAGLPTPPPVYTVPNLPYSTTIPGARLLPPPTWSSSGEPNQDYTSNICRRIEGSEILSAEPVYQEISEKPFISVLSRRNGDNFSFNNQEKDIEKKNEELMMKNESKIMSDEDNVRNDEDSVIKNENMVKKNDERDLKEERIKSRVVYGVITAKQVAKYIPCSQTSIVRDQ